MEWRRGGKQVEEVGNDGGLWAMCVRYGGSIVSNKLEKCWFCKAIAKKR